MKKELTVIVVLLLLLAGCSRFVHPQKTLVPALDAAVRTAALEHNADGARACDVQTEAHAVMGTEQNGDQITVYAHILYQEYRKQGEALSETAGSFVPCVLTFQKNGDGYALTEYWEPRDGGFYAEDIQQKFPQALYDAAADGYWYLEEQKLDRRCREQAEQALSGGSAAGL